MKIVNREEFLKLPGNTLYSKFQPYYFDGLCIKYDTMGNDFLSVSLIDSIECESSEEFSDKLFDALENKKSIAMDFDNCGRDGMFDAKQLFAVWEIDDIKKLMIELNNCLQAASRQDVKSDNTGGFMTKKYEARVMVEYRFTFESEKQLRGALELEAEAIWNTMLSSGLEGEKYHDTEIRVEIS